MSRMPQFFAPGEWYHCYSRGIEKRIVFEDLGDYRRFIDLLYLCNSHDPIHRSDFKRTDFEGIFFHARGAPLVSIGAYVLMPNHFHLMLFELSENGISTFMQKLSTAYTMYFNIKNERSGGLFTKPFRARHVSDDLYLQHLVHYIHLNPIDILSDGRTGNISARLIKKLRAYLFSSFIDFDGAKRAEHAILGKEIFDVYRPVPMQEMLENALAYRDENEKPDCNVKATP